MKVSPDMKMRTARNIFRRYEAGYARWLNECEADRKRGHRPHHCEHGKDQWVDYDNICGGCEDGLFMDEPIGRMEYRRMAVNEAGKWESDMNALYAAFQALLPHGMARHLDVRAAFATIRDRYELDWDQPVDDSEQAA